MHANVSRNGRNMFSFRWLRADQSEQWDMHTPSIRRREPCARGDLLHPAFSRTNWLSPPDAKLSADFFAARMPQHWCSRWFCVRVRVTLRRHVEPKQLRIHFETSTSFHRYWKMDTKLARLELFRSFRLRHFVCSKSLLFRLLSKCFIFLSRLYYPRNLAGSFLCHWYVISVSLCAVKPRLHSPDLLWICCRVGAVVVTDSYIKFTDQ